MAFETLRSRTDPGTVVFAAVMEMNQDDPAG
jgi:hypothetical protein